MAVQVADWTSNPARRIRASAWSSTASEGASKHAVAVLGQVT
jgi:hypothetical protein